MQPSEQEGLKSEVRAFWNRQSCDTQVARSEKFSEAYFDEIERFRYHDQPFIHSFAQFTRQHGRRVLEIGVGAGTDFSQWLRAGAVATGIDLTPEAIENITRRVAACRLPSPEKLLVADAENLPFPDASFDLVYSFGVLHHTPDTPKAVAEAVRVLRPGGELKIMLYNRRSIYVVNNWIKYALLAGRPWRSLSWILWNRIESVGTKGYSRGELRDMLCGLGLEAIDIRTEMTAADLLSSSAFPPLNWVFRLALRLAGCAYDWHPAHYVQRADDPGRDFPVRHWTTRPRRVVYTGNPLGFFHCITARKPG
jgi:SAM-dependent methyltransferase